MTKIKSALVSGLLVSILAGVSYIVGLGDIFALDLRALVNIVTIAFLTSVASLLKSIGTNEGGSFLGAVRVRD